MVMWNEVVRAYSNYAKYLEKQILHPIENGPSMFYLLIGLSLFVWFLEIYFPWRKNQKIIRKDFWLDAFYMFFNYFFFNLIIFAALSSTTERLFERAMSWMGFSGGPVFSFFTELHLGWQLLIFFLIYDFVQWCTHNALHRVPFLWKFHRLHHSVLEMGFAAHLRYHFMENIVYRLSLYIFLSYLFQFELKYTFWLYAITTLIGHLNHANIPLSYGPLKYILNNPKMHIWHHAKNLPHTHPKGMNFGLTLSCWDYIFKTQYEPYSGRDIDLGFENVEKFPKSFLEQLIEPFRKNE
ncbi:MAG: sterol desaturase family protein [Bacteroidetes bacterium]|nr:sterol desaturase family protein [Bacteroidota bacterium]